MVFSTNAQFDRIWQSPDANWLATTADSQALHLWEVNTGKQLVSFSLANEQDTLSFWNYSPDHRYLTTFSLDYKACLWETKTGRKIKCLENIYDGCFSPRGNYWATVGDTAILWESHSGRELMRFSSHTSEPEGVFFSHDEQQLIITYEDSSSLWSIKKEKLIYRISSMYDPYASFTPNNRFAGLFNNDEFQLWDLQTGQKSPLSLPSYGGSYSEMSISFSPDGQQLAVGSRDGIIHLLDVNSLNEVTHFSDTLGQVSDLDFTSDGRYLIAVSLYEDAARVWDLESGTIFRTFYHAKLGSKLAISPDGQFVAIEAGSDSVRMWEIRTGREERTFVGHSHHLNDLCFSL